jgi:hypothetical protein
MSVSLRAGTSDGAIQLNGVDLLTITATSVTIQQPLTLTGHPTIEAVTSTGATGTGNLVFSINPTITGGVLGAGTVTVPPTKFTAGANLSAPAAGAEEYDGTVFYATPVVSNRGVGLTEHFVNNSTAQTGTNVLTAQPWFVTTLTNGQITLPASTTYEFEGLLAVGTTGATSHAIAIGFGGTATLTSIGFGVSAGQNATSLATGSAPIVLYLNTAASTVLTAAVATATYNVIEVHGTVRINAAGTFIPQFTYSAAPGVAPIIAIGTYFRMRPLGTNAVTAVGNWS